jgi:hypothetical protein
MKLTPLFFGRIEFERLKLEDYDGFQKYLASLDGKEVAVSVKKREYVRTTQENRYYWGVIVKMVSHEMAVTSDEAHDLMRWMFLKVGREVGGKRYEIAKSSADLSIGDFEDYCEKCRQWAANELQVSIPLPNQLDEESF